MPITQTPSSIVPALWTYTYVQAPINGQGNPYFNIPSQFTDLGTKTSGTLTLDLATSNVFKVVAGGAFTVAFSNIPAVGTEPKAQFWQLEIKTGGTYSITWPSAIKWDGGGAGNIAPLLSTNTTVLNFMTRDGGTTIFGAYAFADLTV